MSWGLTGTVRNWLSGTQPNFGFLVKRNSEKLGVGGPDVPAATYWGDATQRPRLDVTYTGYAPNRTEPAQPCGFVRNWLPRFEFPS